MSAPLPPYPFPEFIGSGGDASNRLIQFEEALTSARRHGLVSAAPDPLDHTEIDRQRYRTAAMRLWLLGYLDETLSDTREPDLSAAIRRFQEEAGLAAHLDSTGQLDDPTWFALDELVSFETPLTERRIRERWMRGSVPAPVLLRAAQLRLFALGLHPVRPHRGPTALTQTDWEPFLKVNILFGLAGRPLPQGPFPQTLAVLFDQGRIVARLAAAAGSHGSFSIHRLGSMSHREAEALTRTFVVNAAKIELWLLGFDLKLDGRDDYTVGPTTGRPRTNNALREALTSYWRHLEGQSRQEARHRARSITSDLFVSLQRTAEVSEQIETSPYADVSQGVAEQLRSQERIEQAWSKIHVLRSSLWDGLGRVWQWIKRGVKRIVLSMTHFFVNIARAFFRYASRSFKIVQFGLKAVAEGVAYYVKQGLHSHPPGEAVLLNARDFDATLFFTARASARVCDRLTGQMNLKADIFALGTRIVGLVIRTLYRVAIGVTGWARLLLSLVESLRTLKPYYAQLKASMDAYELSLNFA